MSEHESLSGRLGFILLSAGCAIGLGNVWKFPYLVGQYGGGLFVLIYIIFLAILSIPILTMEFSIGRASQKAPSGMYKPLEPEGSKWHIHGYVASTGGFLLLAYYGVVTGWILYYFIKFLTGSMEGLDNGGIVNVFLNLLQDWPLMLMCTAAIVLIGYIICSFGVDKCLEKVSKYMMGGLFILILGMAAYCLTLQGAGSAVDFYLGIHTEVIPKVGFENIIVAAMSQAFFTVGIGIGSMAIFGSYIDKKKSLLGESAIVTGLDFIIAICAGLIIFPACFTFGVSPDSGPPLLFLTMPMVFAQMKIGFIIGVLFFLFMLFAALSTCIALIEMQIASVKEVTGWTRKKTAIILAPIMVLLTVPCILGFSLWDSFQPMGAGSNVLDLEDFVLSYLMVPIGALLFTIFCTQRFGWGWDNFFKEANTGDGLHVKVWMRPFFTYVIPVIVTILLIICLYQNLF